MKVFLVATTLSLVPMQPIVRGPSAHASLMDALSLAEFLATFGVLCEASVLRVEELQRAAARPLGSATLRNMYMALLRCVLLEKVNAGYCIHLNFMPADHVVVHLSCPFRCNNEFKCVTHWTACRLHGALIMVVL